tara:strand:- start:466 stop:663 length:198 start_codon:yes stop_codon:yes gene_type:complete
MKWTKVKTGTWKTKCGQWRAEQDHGIQGDQAWALLEKTPDWWEWVGTWATLGQCKEQVAKYERDV